ncbi:MAG: hypothetical protein KC731_28485 [Myxococcales bacterium]|nr:hypothetical protein [Myxococcales bacterium]
MSAGRSVAAGLLAIAAGCQPPTPAPLPAPIVIAPEAAPSAAPPLPSPDPREDPILDGATLFTGDLARRELRRAILDAAGPLFWSLAHAEDNAVDIPAQSADEPLDDEVVVAEEHPQHLRVVVAGRGVEIAGYVAREHFREVTATRTPLWRSDGEPNARGTGISLPPGTRLELRPTWVDLRRATLKLPWLEASGAVDPKALGRVFRLEAPRPPPMQGPIPEHEVDCLVTAPVTLADGPGGAEIARLTEPGVEGCRLIGEEGEWRRVRIERDGFVLDGFAPAASVSLEPSKIGRGFGFESIGRWHATHTTYRYLWPGDALLPQHGADEIGQVGRVTTRAFKVGDHGLDETTGHRVVHFPIPLWSFTELAIDAETYRRALAKYDAWLSRTRFEKLRVTGPHPAAEVASVLEEDLHEINHCFDEGLEGTSAPSAFRYRVDLEYGPERRKPKLTPEGPSHRDVELCLEAWLRSDHPAGARLRFTLDFVPHPLVDPHGGPP